MASFDLAPFDVVVVPFPFTDRTASKRRPALVLTSSGFNRTTGNSVLAMITSAEQPSWAGDVAVTDLSAAGLASPCLVRLKLFTLDHRLILRKAGKLSRDDREAIASSWKALIFS